MKVLSSEKLGRVVESFHEEVAMSGPLRKSTPPPSHESLSNWQHKKKREKAPFEKICLAGYAEEEEGGGVIGSVRAFDPLTLHGIRK